MQTKVCRKFQSLKKKFQSLFKMMEIHGSSRSVVLKAADGASESPAGFIKTNCWCHPRVSGSVYVGQSISKKFPSKAGISQDHKIYIFIAIQEKLLNVLWKLMRRLYTWNGKTKYKKKNENKTINKGKNPKKIQQQFFTQTRNELLMICTTYQLTLHWLLCED